MERTNQEANPQNNQSPDIPKDNVNPEPIDTVENQQLPQNQAPNPQELEQQNNNPENSQPQLIDIPKNSQNIESPDLGNPKINEQNQDIHENIMQMNNLNQMNLPEMQMTPEQINEQYMINYQNQINQMVNNPDMQNMQMNDYILNYPQVQGQMTQEQIQYQQQQAEAYENKNIYDYQLKNIKLYGIAFQNGNCPRLAISSLEKSLLNKIQILELIDNELKMVLSMDCGYPCTKLLWCPNKNKSSHLAFSSDCMQIFDYSEENHKLEPCAKLTNLKSKYCGPLTSFDWNIANDSILGTASLDNTCTIWDLNKKSIKTQLIAHDKEVFDIQFGAEENVFISGGADGTVRLFDLRSLDHSTIIYETKGCINKLAWNLQASNLIAALSLEKNVIYIFDSRMNTNVSMDELNLHKEPVTGCVWAPDNPTQLCSVSEDFNVIISNVGSPQFQNNNVSYTAPAAINNVDWCKTFPEWIGITFQDRVQLLRK